MQLNQLQQETASAFKELQATNEKGQLDALDKQKLSNLNQSLDSLSLMFDKYLKSQQSPSYQQKAGLTLTTQDQAFQNSGIASQFNEMVRSDSVASTDVGYLQSARVNEMIKNYLNTNSVIRKFATQVAISRESLEYVRNKLDIQAQWNGGTLPPDSVDGYEKFTIKLNDLIAQPKVTYNLINDVQIDFGSSFYLPSYQQPSLKRLWLKLYE
jgi:HK97 family phage major capsid protein